MNIYNRVKVSVLRH